MPYRLFLCSSALSLDDVVCAALHDTGRGYECELGLLLELGDGECAAVAHGGFDLEDGLGDILFQRAGIRNVGVNTLFESEFLVAAQVVALPVACAVGAFTPVLFNEGAADEKLLGRALVETGKVTAQHDEVSAHGQCQSDMVVINDTAVGADGDIDAGLLIILITCLADLDQGSCLAAADALGLTGDADGAAADTDFDEVSAALCQEEEASRLPRPVRERALRSPWC